MVAEESIVGHHKRHRGRIHRWGATAEGQLCAVEATVHLDAGAVQLHLQQGAGQRPSRVAGPYEVPNAHIDSYAVYTNATPGGAFRGFGGPQATFAAETQMNKLAEKLGLDPVEIRRRNVLRNGSIGITQTPMPDGVTLPDVVDRCAAEAGLDRALPAKPAFSPFVSLPAEPAAVRRGRGFACAFKNVGFSFGFPERCEAEIVLYGDPEGDEIDWVEVRHAGADVGQGAHTAFVQMAAEAVGVPVDRVHGTFSDTATDRRLGFGVGLTTHLDGRQRNPGRGGRSRQGVARR